MQRHLTLRARRSRTLRWSAFAAGSIYLAACSSDGGAVDGVDGNDTGGSATSGASGATSTAGTSSGGSSSGTSGAAGLGGTTGTGGVTPTGGSAGIGASGGTGGTDGAGAGGIAGTGGEAGSAGAGIAGAGMGGSSGAAGANGGAGMSGAGMAGAGKGGAGGSAGKGGAGAGGSAGKGGGGAAGSAGKGGSAGSGGGTSCGVSPINPNATAQAKKLLCYLYSQYGNHVISGQQETSWSNPANDPNWINQNTGHYPAILGGDYLYPSGTTSRAQAYWNAGGITMIRYHMGAPPNADSYENSMGSANIANVLANGTNENNSFRSKLDYVAGQLQTLQSANVAVLWAPFHEAQPNGWFWWSKGTGAQFVQLWTYMVNYLTNTKGLNNLIWLMPFSGSPNSSFYPGKQYVDLAGPDTYSTNQPFTSMYNTARNIIGTSVPIPLHETGVIPNPNNMFSGNAAPWVLFNTWAGYEMSNNSLANVQSTYANAYTVTRDEVPNLR